MPPPGCVGSSGREACCWGLPGERLKGGTRKRACSACTHAMLSSGLMELREVMTSLPAYLPAWLVSCWHQVSSHAVSGVRSFHADEMKVILVWCDVGWRDTCYDLQ